MPSTIPSRSFQPSMSTEIGSPSIIYQRKRSQPRLAFRSLSLDARPGIGLHRKRASYISRSALPATTMEDLCLSHHNLLGCAEPMLRQSVNQHHQRSRHTAPLTTFGIHYPHQRASRASMAPRLGAIQALSLHVGRWTDESYYCSLRRDYQQAPLAIPGIPNLPHQRSSTFHPLQLSSTDYSTSTAAIHPYSPKDDREPSLRMIHFSAGSWASHPKARSPPTTDGSHLIPPVHASLEWTSYPQDLLEDSSDLSAPS
ncbi:hypothetical protein BKA70DRAFT_1346788 [Coprinopsis sp. MPI-PUGE-AT-0042]|nr:hypothetical protein BKA70DRAFT_1346788 [Coprinopsis sp. MPI-PUGE-AT-0042]